MKIQVSEYVCKNRRDQLQFPWMKKYSFIKMVNVQSAFCLYDRFGMKEYDWLYFFQSGEWVKKTILLSFWRNWTRVWNVIAFLKKYWIFSVEEIIDWHNYWHIQGYSEKRSSDWRKISNSIQNRGGATSYSPVTSAQGGIRPQTNLTFSFNPFVTRL